MTSMTQEHVDQRERAREFANEVRIHMAGWKRDTRKLTKPEGCVRVADLLCDEDPGLLGKMRLDHAMRSINLIGTARSRTLQRRAGVMLPDRRISELTVRQRFALATLLRVEAEGYQQ